MFRRRFLTFGAFISLLFFFQSLFGKAFDPPLRFSLDDCLELASRNNSKLEARDYAIEAARWRLNESQARFYPVLDVKNRMAPVPQDAQDAAKAFFSGDLTFFDSLKVGVGVPIYAFGQLSQAEKLANQGVVAAREDKLKEEQKLHFEVKQLYYGVLLGRELKNLMGDALQRINSKLASEEKEKTLSPYDTAKLKVFKLDLEKRYEEAVDKESLAKEALKVQLGLSSAQPFELKESYLKPVQVSFARAENVAASALEARPDAHLIDIGIEAKRLEYLLQKRKLFPQVGIGGFTEIGRTTGNIRNLNANDDFNDPFNFTRAGVGVEISGQLNFHAERARRKRLRSEYLKVQSEGELGKRGMEVEVKEAHAEALRLRGNVEKAEERKKLARQMLFLSKSNLDLGVGEEKEYQDALQLVLLTRGEYLKAVFDYNVAAAKLDWKIGGVHHAP